MHNDTTTSANSTPALSAEQLMLFPEASHASHTAAPESASANPMIAICGPKCLESFARLPRAGSWAKTFAGLLLGRADWYSKRCRLIWRLRGTRYRRSYFLLQVSTRRTKGTAFGLLPTVRANKWGLPDSHGNTQAWAMLPTPVASDCKNSTLPPAAAIRNNIPGVLLRNGMSGQLNPRFVEWMMGYPIGWTESEDSETP